MKASIISLLTLSALSLIFLDVEGCSMPHGWKPPTVVEKMNWFRELLMVTVRRQIKEERRYYASSQYTAEVDVLCILRGSSKPAVFNVTRAGYSPGHCWAADLSPGKTYIVGLIDGTQAGAPTIPSQDIPEALNACGLHIPPVYPIGVFSDTASFTCPAGKLPGECKPN